MIIGVTGHRDLKDECISYYEEQVSSLLIDLKREYIDIVIYSPLSDGADRLIVYEAIKLGIEYIAVLPMPQEKYIMDFDIKSAVEFNALINNAKDIVTIPLVNYNTIEEISDYGEQRDLQYEASGRYIADNCDALVALWDEKYINLVGGTGEIVKYYKNQQRYRLYHLLVSRSNHTRNIKLEYKLYDSS